MKRVIFLIIVCLVTLGSAQGAIVHRYGFESDPNDSVGTADGVLVRNLDPQLPQSRYEGGQLILGNDGSQASNAQGGIGDGDYVNLPNGIISALGNQMTIEAWTTWGGPEATAWQRVFDFGTSDGGEDVAPGAGNSRYIMFTTRTGWGDLGCRFGIQNPGDQEYILTHSSISALNTEQHVAITWDGINNVTRLYIDGVFSAENIVPYPLSDLIDNNNWLGRAQFNDSMFNGSYNEFRIYDHAMSAGEVAASLAAGTEVSIASPVYPADGEADVLQLPTLEWVPGYIPPGSSVPTYKIYLSADEAAVAGGSVAPIETGNTSYTLAAALDTDSTYFWRIDQTVTLPGETEPNDIAGGVVSFETIKTYPELSAPAGVVGLIGQSAEITVQISSLTEVAGADWYLYVDGINDQLLAAGGKYAVTTTNEQTMLVISGVEEADAGEYYCIVTNDAGPAPSDNITLVVRQGLVHRYSFTHEGLGDDPNVVDSVSGANGILFNKTGNAAFADGQLVLGNTGGQNSGADGGTGNGDYVDLPNGIISALGNLMTIETWVTWNGPLNSQWQRVFDLGTSNDGEDISGNGGAVAQIFLTPQGAGIHHRFGYRNTDGNEQVINSYRGMIDVGSSYHVALVWDGLAGTAKLYHNGELVGEGGLHFALSEMTDNNNWLGKAQWGDPMFVGSYDEFRIYDIPLDADTILAHYQAGPDVLYDGPPCEEYKEGDVNKDCEVNLEDLGILAGDWLE